jgi:predicted SnoaL-like aldol condensation-catalyzing enzyme
MIDMSDLEQNKRNVVAFYDLMFNQCKPREAIDRFVGDRYIQHNSAVADGKDAFGRSGREIPTGLASISSDSTRMAKSLSTGTYCSAIASCPAS